MGKGRRFNDENTHKLNVKKVIAVIITILVIAMFIAIVVKMIKNNKSTSEKNVVLAYYTVYDNKKWGVINSSGNIVVEPTYDEMILIPNQSKDVFLITYNVDYSTGTYKTKAINSKNTQLFSSYDNIEAITNLDLQNNISYYNNCLKVNKDGKYGLIDFSGKTLLECQYDEITPIKNMKNSLITSKDGKKGLVSATGSVIINNEYSDILALTDTYEDGYIVKNDNNKYGVIGANKKIAVPIEFEEVKNVKSGDNYIIKENGALEIYNCSSNQKVKIDAQDVTSINNDFIVINRNNKYGILNMQGETVIEPTYQKLQYICSTYYIAKLNDKYGIISSDGTTKIEFKYSDLYYRNDADFIEANIENSVESEILDRNLDVRLTGIISEVNTDRGYIKIRIGSDNKYYNFKFEEKKNKEILLDNTLFLDKKNEKYGYIDKNGIVVVNYIYDDATEQNKSGFAAIKKDGKWGAIDSTGKVVVEPTLTLNNNNVINFIGIWHIAEDANAGYYTK